MLYNLIYSYCHLNLLLVVKAKKRRLAGERSITEHESESSSAISSDSESSPEEGSSLDTSSDSSDSDNDSLSSSSESSSSESSVEIQSTKIRQLPLPSYVPLNHGDPANSACLGNLLSTTLLPFHQVKACSQHIAEMHEDEGSALTKRPD